MIHFWQNFLQPFLNSTFLLSLITSSVGLIALLIYRRQHGDEKRDAAQAIYNEIISAENKLKSIRERFFAVQYPALGGNFIMDNENWSRYKYLFVNDLTRPEWDIIDNFYANCRDYDEAVKLNGSYFHEDTRHIFDSIYEHYGKMIEDFHSKNPKKEIVPNQILDEAKAFASTYLNNLGGPQYRPQKPVDDARIALVALDTSVSLSSAGQKIKDLARLKSIRTRQAE